MRGGEGVNEARQALLDEPERDELFLSGGWAPFT